MNAPLISLGATDLALAAILLLIHAALSIWLRLRLERRLLIAAVRMVVQLSLVGVVLKGLFEYASPWLTGLAALVMIFAAGYEITARQERRFSGWWTYGIGSGAMLLGAAVVTLLALTTQVRPDPWYDPRYAIPLLGMVLGNTMTGISLGLNALIEGARAERAGIEAQLCLGADRAGAFRPVVARAVRTALIPLINSMAVVGLVSLPGMMTGQILSGIDPLEAVKYQMLIFFLIAGATGLGVMVAVFAGSWRLSDDRHRLRLDRLGSATVDR